MVHFSHVFFLLQSRKSMVYADHLKAEAEDFMAKHLPKKEDSDKKKGLPYLAVHLRRGDFARSYKGRKGVPSNMKGAAKQINEALKRTGLKVVYVASDASDKGQFQLTTVDHARVDHTWAILPLLVVG